AQRREPGGDRAAGHQHDPRPAAHQLGDLVDEVDDHVRVQPAVGGTQAVGADLDDDESGWGEACHALVCWSLSGAVSRIMPTSPSTSSAARSSASPASASAPSSRSDGSKVNTLPAISTSSPGDAPASS